MTAPRIDWVDYAKGLCIILVVMMHAVLDYQNDVGATGWLDPIVAFAKPFRMPDFFLIAGLFLSRTIHKSQIDYLDRKGVHFAYFYILWLFIQSLFFDGGLIVTDPLAYLTKYAAGLVDPFTTLWFVHMLAVFYLVTWALRAVPKWIVFIAALMVQVAFSMDLIHTSFTQFDKFCAYFVYFYVGYAASGLVFAAVDWLSARPRLACAGLFVWALANTAAVRFGWATLPGVSFAAGIAGAAALMAIGGLMARDQIGGWVRYAGQNSIVIYLTFFIPVKVLQLVFAQTGIIPDVGAATAIILAAGVAAPLIGHWLIKDTPLNFLYQRPPAISISPRYRGGEAVRIA